VGDSTVAIPPVISQDRGQVTAKIDVERVPFQTETQPIQILRLQ
jgi:hypothetical protein